MNTYANDLPIPELIEKLDAHMVNLGYTASTLRHHRQAWNALKNLALAEGATHFSRELGLNCTQESGHL